MNKNKGIIGLGLIVAIVLGIVVVGGGAYYLKGGFNNTNNENTGICGHNGEFCPGTPGYEARIKREKEDQKVAENQKTNTTPQVVTECDSTSKPSIKVLSPNGGEAFNVGQTINIKWSSNCIDANKLVLLNIGVKDSQAVPELLDGLKVANTGSYNFTIPSNYNVGGNKSNKYDLAINYIYGNGESANDHSDSSFTINSAPAKNISTVNWKTYTNTGCGYSFQYPDSWSQGNELNAINLQGAIMGREIDFIDTASQGVETHDGSNNQIYAPKDNMHIECYTMGNAVYGDELSRYNNSSDIFAQNKKTIIVGGQSAIVGEMKNTATASGGEHPGHTIIPSHSTYVFFMHKDQAHALYFKFDTPLNGNDTAEIANFEKLLKTFKFN